MIRMLKKIKHEIFSLEGFYGFLSHLPGVRAGRPNREENEIVVSLTSVPWRLPKLHTVLMSLLWQSVRPDRIVLWLSEYNQKGERILDRNDLPGNLLRMREKGIDIEFVDDIISSISLGSQQ